MPSRNHAATKETRELLDMYDVPTPTYYPIGALIEMQKYVGYKPHSNPKPRHPPLSFSPLELPRSVDEVGGTLTPSWFRYANIDGPEQEYGPMIPGQLWDVKYTRNEDGTCSTLPTLVDDVDREVRHNAFYLHSHNTSSNREILEPARRGAEDLIRNNKVITGKGGIDEAPSMIEEPESSASDTSASHWPDAVSASREKKFSIMGPAIHADLSSLQMLAEVSTQQQVDKQDDSDSLSSLSELEDMDNVGADLDELGISTFRSDVVMDRVEEHRHTGNSSDEHNMDDEDDEGDEDEEFLEEDDDGNVMEDEMIDVDDEYDGDYEE